MHTECVQAKPLNILRAAALIQQGEVVAFPTETVYGLGADALNPAAVAKIFAAKDRPADNPLIVHVADLAGVAPLVTGIDKRSLALMERFWPGPLTLLLPRSSRVPDIVTAGLDTVGVRLPAHPVAQGIITMAGVPLAAPSANRSGKPSPTTAQHVWDDMQDRIPLIVDGGACAVGLESTVLDMSGEVPTILRPGGVTFEMLREALGGEVRLDPGVLAPLADGEAPRSPGMKYKHYAPEAAVRIISGGEAARAICIRALYDEARRNGERPVILAPAGRDALYNGRAVCRWGNLDDAPSAAQALFAALRALDYEGYTLILAEAVPTDGLGLAVMNRLGRAAGFCLIDADA